MIDGLFDWILERIAQRQALRDRADLARETIWTRTLALPNDAQRAMWASRFYNGGNHRSTPSPDQES